MPSYNSKVWNKLANEGPQPLKNESISYAMKQDGVMKFAPNVRSNGAAKNGGGRKVPVYYIEGKHKPKAIINKWIEENPLSIEERTNRSLHHMISPYGDGFKEASREIFGPFDIGGGGDGGKGGQCDICGEEYTSDFPHHIRHECDG